MHNKLKRLLCILGYTFDKDIKCRKINNTYEIIKDDKIIKLSNKHKVYLMDFVQEFSYYFNAVEPTIIDGYYVVDYSTPRLHTLKGYLLHKVVFPSIPEPIDTTNQYIEFADLNEYSIVIDLGAYSGLTSLLFDQQITKYNSNAQGKVISVEADIFNMSCLIQNIECYKAKTNRNIEYVFSAISNSDGYEKFLADGAMGANSNFTNIFRNANKYQIPSITLNSLAKRFALNKVDFIKCDVEGAEKYIFQDKKFFEKYSPKIIIEPHIINGVLTTDSVIQTLHSYNYECKIIKQNGSSLPLIECIRT